MTNQTYEAQGTQPTLEHTRATGVGRWPLASLALCMLLPSLGSSVVNVALPLLARSFGAPFAAVQWVVLSYLVATTSLLVGAGRLGDMLGRRRLLLGGVALFTVASALCGAAPTLWLLIAARAFQGIGAAVMLALVMAQVGEHVPPEHVGRAMGLLATMSAVGTALGPSLGGALAAWAGWRAIFLLNTLLGALVFSLVWRFLAADGGEKRGQPFSFDLWGTALLAALLACYALAVSIRAAPMLNVSLLVATVLGLALFVVVERRAPVPIIKLGMLRDLRLGISLGLSLLVNTVLMTTLVVGPFYLAGGLGLPTPAVGLAMSVGPVVAALSGVPAGSMVDRLGAQRTMTLGLIGIVLGAVLLALFPLSSGLAGYLAPLAAITSGFALFQAANNTAVMASAQREQRGVVSGMLNLSRNLGLITGTSVMGALFAFASGAADVALAPPSAVSQGMRATFALAAAALAAALLGSLLLRRTSSI
ncbi:MFS transporter [Chloroflexia bacterium SDU3-3]|nr:MFS transporter [Chloroflexia bacterium SDU3-3]